jgi:hypothetical protein
MLMMEAISLAMREAMMRKNLIQEMEVEALTIK